MADKAKFVSDFRSAVTTMATAYKHAAELAMLPSVLGWTQDDFASIATGDISASDLYDALAAINSLSTTFASESQKLAKLLP